jgi:hypothetical protein
MSNRVLMRVPVCLFYKGIISTLHALQIENSKRLCSNIAGSNETALRRKMTNWLHHYWDLRVDLAVIAAIAAQFATFSSLLKAQMLNEPIDFPLTPSPCHDPVLSVSSVVEFEMIRAPRLGTKDRQTTAAVRTSLEPHP